MASVFMQGPPMRSKLSYLADRHLKRLIQAGSHDSVQDAQAAMDLVLLKIKYALIRGRGLAEHVQLTCQAQPCMEL